MRIGIINCDRTGTRYSIYAIGNTGTYRDYAIRLNDDGRIVGSDTTDCGDSCNVERDGAVACNRTARKSGACIDLRYTSGRYCAVNGNRNTRTRFNTANGSASWRNQRDCTGGCERTTLKTFASINLSNRACAPTPTTDCGDLTESVNGKTRTYDQDASAPLKRISFGPVEGAVWDWGVWIEVRGGIQSHRNNCYF